MQDRFKFRYVFEKNFGGKTGICYKMPVFNLDDAVRSVFENKIIEYTNFDYKLIAKNQCTGKKDKNNNLIFEGDILKETYFSEDTDSLTSCLYKVEFSQEHCAYCLTEVSNGYKNFFVDLEYIPEDYEIIGNIYENPDLLVA